MRTPRKRGRPSTAELAVVPAEVIDRIHPPAELNDEETEVWAAVVSAQPANWFTPANVPLLVQYCRHVVQAKRVAWLIERWSGKDDPELLGAYLELLKAQRAETSAIKAMAASMRIAQQSTTTHRGNPKNGPTITPPWTSR